MKKIIIAVSPICIVLFVLIWILCGLKAALAVFGALLFSAAFVFACVIWIEFVDKHIKD